MRDGATRLLLLGVLLTRVLEIQKFLKTYKKLEKIGDFDIFKFFIRLAVFLFFNPRF